MPPPPVNKPRRIVGRLVFVAALLIIGALVWYQLVLPGIVESRLIAALDDMGLSNAALRVDAVSTTALHVSDIEVAGLLIPAMRVTYTLGDLRAGRVDAVDVYAPKYAVHMTSEGIDLGPLVQWAQALPPSDRALPFSRVTIHGGELTLGNGDATWNVPVAVTVTPGSAQVDYAATAVASLPGAELRIESNSVIPLSVNLLIAGRDAGSAVFDENGDGHITWDWKGNPPSALRHALAGIGLPVIDQTQLQCAGTCYWIDGGLQIETIALSASQLADDASAAIDIGGQYRHSALALTLNNPAHFADPARGRIDLHQAGDAPLFTWANGQPSGAVDIALNADGMTIGPVSDIEGTVTLGAVYRDNAFLVHLREAGHLAAPGFGRVELRPDGDMPIFTWADGKPQGAVALAVNADGIAIGSVTDITGALALGVAYRDAALSLHLREPGQLSAPALGRIALRPVGDAPLFTWMDGKPQGAVAVAVNASGMHIGDVTDIDAAVTLAGEYKDNTFTLRLTEPGHIATPSLGRIDLRPDGDTPLLTLSADQTHGALEAAIATSTLHHESLGDVTARVAFTGECADRAVTLRLKDDSHITTANFGRIDLRAIGDSPAFTWSGDAPKWAIEAAIVKPTDITVGDIKLTGVKGAVPITSQPRGSGLWSVQSVKAAGMQLTDLEGTARVIGTELRFAAERFPINNTTREWNITGDVAVSGSLTYHGGEVRPEITIEMFDAGAISEPLALAAEGVTGSITINSFDPLATPGGQRVYARRILFSRMVLEDGHVVFRLESPQSLLIEKTDWRFDKEGRMWAHGFRVNPDAVAFEAQLFIQDMPLMRWISEISDGRIVGEGRFHGRIPFNYNATRKHRILLGDGYLYATPGLGRFRVTNTKLIDSLLADSGIDFHSNPDMKAVRNNFIEAVKDFEYSELSLDFIPEKQGMLTRLQFAGKGRTGAKQELGGITFNIRGIEQVLNTSLLLKSGGEGGFQQSVKRLFAEPSKTRE